MKRLIPVSLGLMLLVSCSSVSHNKDVADRDGLKKLQQKSHFLKFERS
jgi:uncharacterized protein YcfL